MLGRCLGRAVARVPTCGLAISHQWDLHAEKMREV